MKQGVKWLRRFGALVVGIPLLIVGLILIPLPGPGVLVCFGALYILSFEFEWARKYRDKCQSVLSSIWNASQARAKTIEAKADPKAKPEEEATN